MVPINFWLLVSGSAAPPISDVQLCQHVLTAHRRGDATSEIASLVATGRPVAVELEAPPESRSIFLPCTARAIALQEISFGDAGFGGKVWEAGIALGIWLAERQERVRGQRVLELGSGVGFAGLAACAASANQVTLTDLADRPALLRTLERNALDNGFSSAAAVKPLDWHDCLNESFTPLGAYDLILGADCIYYESDAPALAAALARHTAPGGTAVLMNRVGRAGDAVQALMRCLRDMDGGDLEEVQEMTVVNNYSEEALSLVQWTKHQDENSASRARSLAGAAG